MIKKIKYDYDLQNDSLFTYINDDYIYDHSIELNDNIILDLDKDYKPVAIEVLDASKIFKTTKVSINNLSSFKVNIKINDKLIELTMTLTVKVHNKPCEQEIESCLVNDMNIPSLNAELGIV